VKLSLTISSAAANFGNSVSRTTALNNSSLPEKYKYKVALETPAFFGNILQTGSGKTALNK